MFGASVLTGSGALTQETRVVITAASLEGVVLVHKDGNALPESLQGGIPHLRGLKTWVDSLRISCSGISSNLLIWLFVYRCPSLIYLLFHIVCCFCENVQRSRHLHSSQAVLVTNLGDEAALTQPVEKSHGKTVQ